MAENGILINSNDSTATRTATFVIQWDRTESDATHCRLRDDLQPVERINCLSCNRIFTATSLVEIYAHYREIEHQQYYGSCLYCQGKVHQYFHTRNQGVHIYHNCLRWKRGEDK